MCTSNLSALEMDRQVFWETNYLHLSEVFFQPSSKSTFLTYLAFLAFKIYKIQIFNKMIEKKEDNIRSESYYPDSNYYLDQNNTNGETSVLKDPISKTTKFEWPKQWLWLGRNTLMIYVFHQPFLIGTMLLTGIIGFDQVLD